ncbi:MAG: hypothetical protein FWF99_00295 [Desulfovibrionaceae bacterium]|nr:hypothetical protein [Desulfovibrionaceae bacterium]
MLVALLAIFGAASCVYSGGLLYPQPEFSFSDEEGKGAVVVVDTFGLPGSKYDSGAGGMEDFVKLHNNSRDSNMSFRVYVHDHDTGQWRFMGTSSLKGPGDTGTVSRSRIKNLKNYRYFAVESLNGKRYNMSFYKYRNDLYVSVE